MKFTMAKNVRQIDGKGTRGFALILVLLSMLILSVLAAGIVFTARSETLSSHSFEVNTEADYLAKAGIQQAINWLRSPHYQGVPEPQASTYYCVTSTGTPYNLFTADSEPVQLKGASCPNAGSPVQLIGYGRQTTNYPAINNTESPPRAVATAYATDLKNIRVTGDAGDSGTFSVNMYLLSYQTVNQGLTPPYSRVPLETWLITSLATWTGSSTSTTAVATAEEQAIVHGVYLPNWGNAMYAYCSVQMSGSSGACTDAFNSALGQYDGGVVSLASKCNSSGTNVIDSGAGIGANGYVTLSKNVNIDGNVIVGPGTTACPSSNDSIKGTVYGQVVNGPLRPVIPAPTFRSGFPGTAPSVSSGVVPSGASWPAMPPFPATPTAPASNSPPVLDTSGNAIHSPCMDATCDGTTAHPFEINSLSLSSSGTAQLVGGPDPFHPVVYDIESLSESGNGVIDVSGYVVLNVQGSIDIGGNGITNGVSGTTDIPPESVVINSAGTTVNIHGNGAVSALVNAPNATVTLGGGGSKGYFVGAIQANNIFDNGGYPLHYDVQLASHSGGAVSVPIITAYSRRKI